MCKNYIPFVCFSSYHLHVSLMEYQYESTSFYTCVLFNFHIDEFKLRVRLPFGISSRGVVVIVDKNTIHKCDFAKYIFDTFSKCDLSSQIIITLFNVHKWYVCRFASAEIRAPTVEFLKVTLISRFYFIYIITDFQECTEHYFAKFCMIAGGIFFFSPR